MLWKKKTQHHPNLRGITAKVILPHAKWGGPGQQGILFHVVTPGGRMKKLCHLIHS